jgi:hypothetical protein
MIGFLTVIHEASGFIVSVPGVDLTAPEPYNTLKREREREREREV